MLGTDDKQDTCAALIATGLLFKTIPEKKCNGLHSTVPWTKSILDHYEPHTSPVSARFLLTD